MLSTSSATLVSMLSQLSEAEEQKRVFSGKERWNQVRSLADAKNVMNYLFNIVSSSREKDMEIRDLKEKFVGLSYSLRQLDMIKAELSHKLKLQSDALKRYSEYVGDSEYSDLNVGGHKYYLCKPEYRWSTHLLEDMDISETESDDLTDDGWEESGKLKVWKRKSKTRRSDIENNQSNINNLEDFKENSGDILVDTPGETASDICCSCSRTSLCKTAKCKCKAMGNSCGSSCGCLATKCVNRASISSESQEPTQSASIEETGLLVTQGAGLLQGALVDRLDETNSGRGHRKPLSDIGNTQVKSNAKNDNPKKKTATVIIVPNPPPSSQAENSEVPIPIHNLKFSFRKEKFNFRKENNNNTNETSVAVNKPRHKRSKSRPENAASAPRAEGNFVDPDAPLKMPRAVRREASSNSSGVPFWDRNAAAGNKSDEPEVFETRNPLRHKRSLDEKENNRR
ncbi:hypothetical protein JHK82_014828 [Glycine max]|nr:hypothetical protein JHK86_014845 [Glycine max]KAG5147947.1 hypothetical protein JHK82_014828 [Glycine max]